MSVPTTTDPKSRRPVKRRALSPLSAQAASLDALFAKPDQEIRLSSSSTGLRPLPPPPEIVTNVQGSSAGAGSGEFHVYKAARRREYERLRRMDVEARQHADTEQFELNKVARIAKDETKTSKNRARREKARARKERARMAQPASQGQDDHKDKDKDDNDNDGDDEQHHHSGPATDADASPALPAPAPAPPAHHKHHTPPPPAGLLIHDQDDD